MAIGYIPSIAQLLLFALFDDIHAKEQIAYRSVICKIHKENPNLLSDSLPKEMGYDREKNYIKYMERTFCFSSNACT